MEKSQRHQIISAFVLAVGIALCGHFIGQACIKMRLFDRSVVVKGLAEREVESDLAIWPIAIKATGDDLAEVNKKVESDRAMVIDFLISQGFEKEEISLSSYDVDDLLTHSYRTNYSEASRYIITAQITLKTSKTALTQQANRCLSLLVQKGIVLGGERGGPNYEFTQFNAIKPDILAEAIKNARQAAEKFSVDSGSQLGMLKRANQGIVRISPADSTEEDNARKSIRKQIRMVVTLEYGLD